MFIAHLPSGYLLSCALLDAKSTIKQSATYRTAMTAGLLGSIAPDIDMLRFYFLDDRQFHHHSYFTHMPLFWFGVWIVLCAGFARVKRSVPFAVHMFMACALLHMILDSIASKMYWLWPFSNASFQWVVVPATQSHWVLSFLTHWTFGIEIVLCLFAGLVFFKRYI